MASTPIEEVKCSLPLGTYSGKEAGAKKSETAYSVRLMESCKCWFDCTTKSPISSSSWHAEGSYKQEVIDGNVVSVRFTVEALPHGGAPGVEKGRVYVWGVHEGATAKTLIVEGIMCPLQAGVPDIDTADYMSMDYMNSAPALVVPKAVPEAVPRNPIEVSPSEGAPTKVMCGEAGIVERTKVDTKPDDVKEVSEVPAAAPMVPAPAEVPVPPGCFSLEDLKDESVWRAKGVDAGNREEYLSEDTFKAVFGMGKADFAKLAKWKRDSKKKEHGLF